MLCSLLLVLLIVVSLVGCSMFGVFFGVVDGLVFVVYLSVDVSYVIVYFYCLWSQWVDEEFEVLGIFFNNELIGSLLSNGYLVFEFEIGSYKLEMCWLLVGSFWILFVDGLMDFICIVSFMFEVRVGLVYYLCYDEFNLLLKSEYLVGEGDGLL